MSLEAERVGPEFSSGRLHRAQTLTLEAIHELVPRMVPGLLETQARTMAEEVLRQKGANRFWHRTHVRFGVNTTKSFGEMSLPGVRLQERDIFFFDFGPVFDGLEGDAGLSFSLGADREMRRCVSDARTVFELVRDRWRERRETGRALVDFAVGVSQERGWNFLLEGASGHRIADFPHRLYHRGSLHALAEAPAADRWILEVHLRHPKRPFGAFYEDILA